MGVRGSLLRGIFLTLFTAIGGVAEVQGGEPPSFPADQVASDAKPDPRYADLLTFGLRGLGDPTPQWLARGLDFLCSKQTPSGLWRATSKHPENGLAVSALAILALAAAGVDPDSPTDVGLALSRGLSALIATQDEQGCIGGASDTPARSHATYVHAFTTLALVQVVATTANPKHYESARKALAYSHLARNPFFGWRYGVKAGENDTSVTGWMVSALLAARALNTAGAQAGLEQVFEVDELAFEGVQNWLERMLDEGNGVVGYQLRGVEAPEDPKTPFLSQGSLASTAICVFCKHALGRVWVQEPGLARATALVGSSLPTWSKGTRSDFYSWYWGAQAMHATGGPASVRWRQALEAALIPAQDLEKGFWRADDDPWGPYGGAVYTTSMALLSLLVGREFQLVPTEPSQFPASASAKEPSKARIAALRALALRPVEGASGAAAAALATADLNLRRAGAATLSISAKPEDGPVLLKAAADPDGEVASHVAFALARLGSDAALPGLVRALDANDRRTRCRALWALGELGTRAASAAAGRVRTILVDPDPAVALEAICTLWRLEGGTPTNLDRVRAWCTSDNKWLRRRAFEVLSTFGPTVPLDADTTMKGLTHSDTGTVAAAAARLRSVGREVRGLRLALQDVALFGREPSRQAAAAVLSSLTARAGPLPGGGKAAVPKPDLPTSVDAMGTALSDAATAESLRGALRAPAALSLLLPLLEHRDELVRVRAIEVLEDLGPAAKEAVTPLARATQIGSAAVASASLRALFRVQPTEPIAITAFVAGLSSPSPEVRAAALDAIAASALPPPGIDSALRAFVGRDGRPQVLVAFGCAARRRLPLADLHAFLPALSDRPDLFVREWTAAKPVSRDAGAFLLAILDEQPTLVPSPELESAFREVGRQDSSFPPAVFARRGTAKGVLLERALIVIGKPVAKLFAKELGKENGPFTSEACYCLRAMGTEASVALADIVPQLQYAWLNPDRLDSNLLELTYVFAASPSAGRSALLQGLSSRSPGVRGGCAVIMSRLGGSDFVAALKQALPGEKDSRVRDQMAIGARGTK